MVVFVCRSAKSYSEACLMSFPKSLFFGKTVLLNLETFAGYLSWLKEASCHLSELLEHELVCLQVPEKTQSRECLMPWQLTTIGNDLAPLIHKISLFKYTMPNPWNDLLHNPSLLPTETNMRQAFPLHGRGQRQLCEVYAMKKWDRSKRSVILSSIRPAEHVSYLIFHFTLHIHILSVYYTLWKDISFVDSHLHALSRQCFLIILSSVSL